MGHPHCPKRRGANKPQLDGDCKSLIVGIACYFSPNTRMANRGALEEIVPQNMILDDLAQLNANAR